VNLPGKDRPIAAADPADSNSIDSGQEFHAEHAQNFAMQLSGRRVRRVAAAAFRARAMTERDFMAQFSWTDDLYTGDALIDGDHRKLVELVNAFFQCMQSGQDQLGLCTAMSDLVTYTGEHFRREEAEMERTQYVAALAHQAEHAKLLKQLAELKLMLDAGGRMNIPAVADFLSQWLRDHILTKDMKLAAALGQRRSPAPAPQPH
jgi:hemerythrin-like metal-binding protein